MTAAKTCIPNERKLQAPGGEEVTFCCLFWLGMIDVSLCVVTEWKGSPWDCKETTLSHKTRETERWMERNFL